jgi:hypothetical protein
MGQRDGSHGAKERTSRPCLCNHSPARPIANFAGAIFPVKGRERAPLPVCALLDVASPPLLCGSMAEQTNSPLRPLSARRGLSLSQAGDVTLAYIFGLSENSTVASPPGFPLAVTVTRFSPKIRSADPMSSR